MKCRYCHNEASKRYIKGYCNACYLRLVKTGDIRLKCLSGPHAIGATRHPLYATWVNMKTRCYNKNNKSYPRYGGRGIRVCDRWMEKPYGFQNFVADVGERPQGCSLDRIDVNGNYCKENCRWATPTQQALNRRSNSKVRGVCKTPIGYKAFITYNGRFYSKRFKNFEEAFRWRIAKEKELGVRI